MGTATLRAILMNEMRVLRSNRAMPVMLLGMPLIIIAMLRSTMGAALADVGIAGRNGAEQVVPGQALLFGFFMVSFLANSFFREHGWATWDRLRTSRASRGDIFVGKALPWVIASAVQIVTLLTLGFLLFDLAVPSVGGLVAIALTGVVWALFIGGFALAVSARLQSMPAVSAVSNLGAMFFSAVGGALVPSGQLPGWASAIGPFTPTYWAMESFNTIFLEEGSLVDAVPAIAALGGFAIASAAYAWFRFDFDQPKRSWV